VPSGFFPSLSLFLFSHSAINLSTHFGFLRASTKRVRQPSASGEFSPHRRPVCLPINLGLRQLTLLALNFTLVQPPLCSTTTATNNKRQTIIDMRAQSSSRTANCSPIWSDSKLLSNNRLAFPVRWTIYRTEIWAMSCESSR